MSDITTKDIEDFKKNLSDVIKIGQENNQKTEGLEKATNDLVQKHEELQKKSIQEKDELEKKIQALEERCKNLDTELLKNSSSKMNEEDKIKKNFELLGKHLCLKDSQIEALGDMENMKTFRAGVQNEGASLLMPTLIQSVIVTETKKRSPMSRICGVITIPANYRDSKKLVNTVELEDLKNAYVGEGESAYEGANSFQSVKFNLKKLKIKTQATEESLNFSMFNVEGELTQNALTKIALGRDYSFLQGNKDKEPSGILRDTRIPSVTMTGNKVTFKSLIDMMGLLPEVYSNNASMIMNRQTLMNLLLLKDDDNSSIFKNSVYNFGINSPIVSVLGMNVVVMDHMAAPAANGAYTAGDIAIMIGNFSEGYKIFESAKGTMLQKFEDVNKGLIDFVWTQYNDGKVLLPNAFVSLKS